MFYIMHNIGNTKVSVLDTDDMIAEVVTRRFVEESDITVLNIKDFPVVKEFYSDEFNFIISDKFIYISNKSVVWRLKLVEVFGSYHIYTWRGIDPETVMMYSVDLKDIIIYKESDRVIMQIKSWLACFVFDESGVIGYYENCNKNLSLNNSIHNILHADNGRLKYQEDFKEYVRKDQSAEKRKELLG